MAEYHLRTTHKHMNKKSLKRQLGAITKKGSTIESVEVIKVSSGKKRGFFGGPKI